jgi:hypothetical protein
VLPCRICTLLTQIAYALLLTDALSWRSGKRGSAQGFATPGKPNPPFPSRDVLARSRIPQRYSPGSRVGWGGSAQGDG